MSAHSGFNKCLLILRLLKFQTTQYLVNSTGCLHCIFFVVVVTDPEVSLNISVQRLPRPFTVTLYSRRSTRLMQTDSAAWAAQTELFSHARPLLWDSLSLPCALLQADLTYQLSFQAASSQNEHTIASLL